MQILGLLGMSFDAVVVEIKKDLLLFRFAQAILCENEKNNVINCQLPSLVSGSIRPMFAGE